MLHVPVSIPCSSLHVGELAERLIAHHSIPPFEEVYLKTKLKAFVELETNKVKDAQSESYLVAMKEGKAKRSVVKVVDAWTKAYTMGWRQYAKPEEPSDTLLFSEVYGALIHSAAMESLLHIEHSYALTMEDLVKRRDEDLEILEVKQEEEMVVAVKGLGTTFDDSGINDLATRHFEHAQILESKWASEISLARDAQRREYRSWVMQLHEVVQTSSELPADLERIRKNFDAKSSSPQSPPGSSPSSSASSLASGFKKLRIRESQSQENTVQQTTMEESFTIHLGTQMKSSFNLRLLRCDMIDHFCRHRPLQVDGQLLPSPQRLQTAMGLYSNSLTGMVLLVDNRLNSFSGLKRKFARACDASTDFHFDNLQSQLDSVKIHLDAVNKSRAVSDDATKSPAEVAEWDTCHLQPGDFYLTRHSNLAQVHAVFHLAVDDSVRDGSMTSRHFAILSIRNILKMCSQFDLTTICIPLLLTHEMGEEMTIPWCVKRAELVFKCVKGFMMEMGTWEGSGSAPDLAGPQTCNREIRFVVPSEIDETLFQTFSNMLPNIFRLSNTLVVKTH